MKSNFRKITTSIIRLLLFMLVFISCLVHGNDGDLDTSFGDNGVAIVDFPSLMKFNVMMDIQSNGEIILGSQVYGVLSTSQFKRLNTDLK